MEEINLDLESDNHKSVNIGSSITLDNTPSNNINIFKDNSEKKESNIGIDLLINKNKTGNSDSKSLEFKPSDPVLNNDSIERNNITLNLSDIGSSKPTVPISSITETKPITSISMEKEKKDELDLNLDDLFSDDKKTTTNILNDNTNTSNIDLNVQETEKPKSYEELQKEKAEFLRLLERLEQKGIHSHKKFNMNSEYSEIKTEFERLSRQRECNQSVKFQRKMLIAFVTAVEFLNTKFDPFDVKLEGWSESVHENANDYDDVFEELHEKYKSKSKMAPELKLLFMLGGSGFMFHLTNTMFKSSLPGMGDIMKQNPDLMKQFAQATASSMGGSQPGFSNFMGDILGGGGGGGQSQRQKPRKEMDGPPNINDIINNMNSNKVDIDMHSNYSESDIENTKSNTMGRNKRSINLDI
jgi:hypothetical protein